MGTKAGNISFKAVCKEFAKQDHKARREFHIRNKGFYTQEFQDKAETERKARIAAYLEKNGTLPVFVSERQETPNIQPMGFEKAVQYTEIPTRVEKPIRRTFYKSNTGRP